jgi:raffinose/stachyose/melibiose transport system substrate-binding protein
MKNAKTLVLAALCAAAALFVAGCKKDEGSGITLNVWHIWPSETESQRVPFLKVIRDYQALHPEIRIVEDATENEAYKTKIRSAVAAGEAPDLFFYWSGGTMKGFVDAGAALPLDEYLSDADRQRMLPGTTVNSTFNGKIYGLPHTQAVGTFYVNQELFDQNGLAVPTTWDELLTVSRAFLAKGITPLAIGAKDTWCIAMYFDLMHLRQNGYTANRAALTRTGPFNTPGTIEAARKLQQLVDMGAFGRSALALNRDEAEVPFYEGKIPMYVNGSWVIGNINRPDYAVRDKINIYSFPVLGSAGSARDLTGGASDIFIVNAKTKYPKEAAEFAKYIAEHFTAELYQAGAGLPTWRVEVDESKIDRLTRNMVDLFAGIDTYTLWWDTLLEGEAAQTYLNALSSLFAKQITPEQFAETMQSINK